MSMTNCVECGYSIDTDYKTECFCDRCYLPHCERCIEEFRHCKEGGFLCDECSYICKEVKE